MQQTNVKIKYEIKFSNQIVVKITKVLGRYQIK